MHPAIPPVHQESTMNVRIELSDRTRAANVEIDEPFDIPEAIAQVVGKRFLHARQDSYRNDSAVYEVAVSTGPTRNGSTPFQNIRAYVSINA